MTKAEAPTVAKGHIFHCPELASNAENKAMSHKASKILRLIFGSFTLLNFLTLEIKSLE